MDIDTPPDPEALLVEMRTAAETRKRRPWLRATIERLVTAHGSLAAVAGYLGLGYGELVLWASWSRAHLG